MLLISNVEGELFPEITMTKFIQKHFYKIAFGSGLSFGGASQYFSKIGSALENEASVVASDFMDAFAADLELEMEIEIRKFGKLIKSGSNKKVITEKLEREATVVGKDLSAAFKKDLNNAIEKEVMRLTKRVLHDS